MKCQLCLKSDNGCYFTKKSHVYVFCGTYEQKLGSGTLSDPYNLFKISQLEEYNQFFGIYDTDDQG
ncbi:hypothetical protein TTHERM_01081840 (macronuclear) [Tetrahymena thermophila SB210]|uniref:Uncharacterized protein n=1 Tax=Tetrahymena thermophila (strain SB210) TaxID=312017 RepID=Q227Z8_TETTS|nr:hypothetical protein TTHERM_01619830 [Tetrahymena thermophila SB210]XP_001030487.2 hypothetical protein TTHERM_01081840 [Tetrahymena thermophila SB210]EAR81616.2 hypothetical protein TTHERM_01619830 [Tetrahymena thermophila SB210]EAR82824.2 hypothetical protein TTHERM_01081840 [Tetrahymena thermophila SB210]|eukprot:XP_001029279.2 hypothetical protein TTHERM_01619830 [Tetrahymena thermophila SB210]